MTWFQFFTHACLLFITVALLDCSTLVAALPHDSPVTVTVTVTGFTSCPTQQSSSFAPSLSNLTSTLDSTIETYNSTSYLISLQNSSATSTYQIKDNNSIGDVAIAIDIPVVLPTDLSTANVDGVAFALPAVLKQLDVPSENINSTIEQTSTAFSDAVLLVFNQSDSVGSDNTLQPVGQVDTTIEKRGCCFKGNGIKDAVNVVKKIIPGSAPIIDKLAKATTGQLCSIFAYNTVAGYLATAASVRERNPSPGLGITRHQMFFLHPIYGDFPLQQNLRVHYNLRKFLNLGEYHAITFNRDIYVPDDYQLSAPPSFPTFAYTSFIQTLVHETKHTQQYQANGWSLPRFGFQYMSQYCAAGYSYSKIAYEKDAYAIEHTADFLVDSAAGSAYFRFWRQQDLYSTLGYPTATKHTLSPGYTQGRYELPFQRGLLQCRFYTGGGRACRAFTSAEIRTRTEPARSCPGLTGRCEPAATRWGELDRRGFGVVG